MMVGVGRISEGLRRPLVAPFFLDEDGLGFFYGDYPGPRRHGWGIPRRAGLRDLHGLGGPGLRPRLRR
jgi:hypothetical protein